MSNHIITIGTGALGGIDSVIKGYISSGLYDKYKHTRIISHLGNSKLEDIYLFISSFFKLLFLCLSNNKLILHCHMSYNGSFWRKLSFVLLAKLFRKTTFVHLHGSEFKIFFNSRGGFSKKLILWMINNVDEFIVLSDSWRAYLNEFSSRNFLVINNYVDITPVRSQRNKGHILFLGAFIPRKGIYDLIKACSLLNVDYHLHLCGAGEDRKVIALIKKLQLENKVTIHGWVDKESKVELLCSCSVMILPSYNEGLPMTLIESMGCRIPIITTTVGAIPEVIDEGVTGYLIEPGNVDMIINKLNYVLSSPDSLSQVIDNAEIIYKTMFTSRVILPKLQEAYARYETL